MNRIAEFDLVGDAAVIRQDELHGTDKDGLNSCGLDLKFDLVI